MMVDSDAPSVLVVDDDQDIAVNVSDILREMGYRADVAYDGSTALQLASQRVYDLALLDYKMPDMSGAALYTRIRQEQPGIVAIMVTAYAGADGVEEAKRAGTWQVLRKPVDVAELLGFIEKALLQPLVLVVDDDVAVCSSLRDLLCENGYRVGVVHDVAEAVRQLESRAHDMVLLDLKLGYQRADEVFRDRLSSGTMPPTILITGFRSELQQVIDGLVGSGALAVCYKPLDLGELIRLLDRKRASG